MKFGGEGTTPARNGNRIGVWWERDVISGLCSEESQVSFQLFSWKFSDGRGDFRCQRCAQTYCDFFTNTEFLFKIEGDHTEDGIILRSSQSVGSWHWQSLLLTGGSYTLPLPGSSCHLPNSSTFFQAPLLLAAYIDLRAVGLRTANADAS